MLSRLKPYLSFGFVIHHIHCHPYSTGEVADCEGDLHIALQGLDPRAVLRLYLVSSLLHLHHKSCLSVSLSKLFYLVNSIGYLQ